jgi:hypothetical protein
VINLDNKLYDISLYLQLLTYKPDYDSNDREFAYLFDITNNLSLINTDSINDFISREKNLGFYAEFKVVLKILENLFESGKFLFFYELLMDIKKQDKDFISKLQDNFKITLSCKCDNPFDADDSYEYEYLDLYEGTQTLFYKDIELLDFLCLIISSNFSIDFRTNNHIDLERCLNDYLMIVEKNENSNILLMMMMQIMHLRYQNTADFDLEKSKKSYYSFLDKSIINFKLKP